MVAASGARWRDRSKDHGENHQTRQGCRQTRALAKGRPKGKAGRQGEGGQRPAARKAESLRAKATPPNTKAAAAKQSPRVKPKTKPGAKAKNRGQSHRRPSPGSGDEGGQKPAAPKPGNSRRRPSTARTAKPPDRKPRRRGTAATESSQTRAAIAGPKKPLKPEPQSRKSRQTATAHAADRPRLERNAVPAQDRLSDEGWAA